MRRGSCREEHATQPCSSWAVRGGLQVVRRRGGGAWRIEEAWGTTSDFEPCLNFSLGNSLAIRGNPLVSSSSLRGNRWKCPEP